MAPSPLRAALPFGGCALAVDNPVPSPSTRPSAASPGQRAGFQTLGQGEINVIPWFDLSFWWRGAALHVVCAVQLLQRSLAMGSSSYFASSARWIFIGLSLITLYKCGGNICKVGHVEVWHQFNHAVSGKSFCQLGAGFVRSWGWGGSP